MMAEAADTAQIEQDLAETRARMDERLDELQGKFSPSQMINDAFAHFRDGDGGDFTMELIDRAKANPVPLAITAVGVVWLLASGKGSPKQALKHGGDMTRSGTHEASTPRHDGELEEAYQARLDEGRGAMLGMNREATETTASYSQRIKDALATAKQTANARTRNMQSNVQDLYGRVRSAGGMSAITSNPVALGAIAAIGGLVAGSLLPTTDREEDALGATASKLRTSGRDLAQNASRKARMHAGSMPRCRLVISSTTSGAGNWSASLRKSCRTH
jgi:hypothetical protein